MNINRELHELARKILSDNLSHEERQYIALRLRLIADQEGCICQGCGRKYKVDLLIPDDLWDQIIPKEKRSGGGMLCGRCIMDKIEALGEFNAFRMELIP